jgi:hypothetical protein
MNVNISTAENQLKKMKKNGKTFQQFLHDKLVKELRNMEEANLRRAATAKRANNNNNNSSNSNSNSSSNSSSNKGTARKTKKKGITYASIAATAKRRIKAVEDTYTEIYVRNLPITNIAVHNPDTDLAKIIKILKGCFGINIFGRGKEMPKMGDLTVKIGLAPKKGGKTVYPEGYAFIAFPKHEHAKMVIDFMKDPDTKKPTFGQSGHIIQGKDVEPKYGERAKE